MTGEESSFGYWIRRYKSDTALILKKCAECKKYLLCTRKTPKNQGKSAQTISEKRSIKVLLQLLNNR